MPIRLSELISDLRWIKVEIAGQELNIAYRPNAMNIEFMARLEGLTQGDIEQLAKIMPMMIAEWDLQDDDNAMIPITEQTFRRLPWPLLQAITETMTDSLGSDTEKKVSNGTYAAGLPPVGRSGNAPTGIPSSERPNTWA